MLLGWVMLLLVCLVFLTRKVHIISASVSTGWSLVGPKGVLLGWLLLLLVCLAFLTRKSPHNMCKCVNWVAPNGTIINLLQF